MPWMGTSAREVRSAPTPMRDTRQTLTTERHRGPTSRAPGAVPDRPCAAGELCSKAERRRAPVPHDHGVENSILLTSGPHAAGRRGEAGPAQASAGAPAVRWGRTGGPLA